MISGKGVEADPEKAKAVREFPQPTNVKELQRFNSNGMVNQRGSIKEPPRQLLRKGNQFLRDHPQFLISSYGITPRKMHFGRSSRNSPLLTSDIKFDYVKIIKLSYTIVNASDLLRQISPWALCQLIRYKPVYKKNTVRKS